MQKKTLLTKQMKIARMNWTKTYFDWKLENWQFVCFSDECIFDFHSDMPQRCWRRPSESMMTECLTTRAKYGSGGIMV